MNYRALCFVDMPFGQKPDLKSGTVVDFDQIYNQVIKPAIKDLRAARETNSAQVGSSTARCLRGCCFLSLSLSVPAQPHQKKWFTN
jgi:hypothetical protein